jgi:hypothetical protein
MVETDPFLGAVFFERSARVLATPERGCLVEPTAMNDYNNSRQESSGTDIELRTERSRVPVAGGLLVYEQREVGRELIGFENVTDWGELGDAVAARGHSRGDALHLPELDNGDSGGRAEPVRSEPADFGHGESTGV